MKNILVVFGGRSCESDVSVVTGLLTVSSLDVTKYNAIPLYVSKSGKFYTGEALKKLETFKKYADVSLDPSVSKAVFLAGENTVFTLKKGKLVKGAEIAAVINCCHGGVGENGSLSGYFVVTGIPVCSPEVFACSVTMDKSLTKIFLKGLKILSPNYVAVKVDGDVERDVKRIEEALKYPVIVKPSSQGSSIGIGVAKNKKELIAAINYAYRFDNTVIVEQYLDGAEEFNCAAYKNGDKIVVSECEKPLYKGEILTFDDKYISGDREFPAKISAELSNEIKSLTERVYSALDCVGVIRVDYLYYRGKLYLNEVNSVPGSLALYLFSNKPNDFKKVLDDIITTGERRYNIKKSAFSLFETNIFTGGSKGKASKRLE